MGVLVGYTRQQSPCSICGKDAYQPGPGGPMAIVCSSCGVIACRSCAAQPADAQGISLLACPRCRKGGMPTYLDSKLVPNSVWTMPRQSLDGWPELEPLAYGKIIGEVARYLPVLEAALKDIIPEQDMPAAVERMCFALSTGAYMEWCFNRQEDVRTYVAAKSRRDFAAPSLPEMVELICGLIAEEAKKTTSIVILEDDQRRRDEMLAVLRETYPDVEISVFSDAQNFVALMKARLRWVNLVCLDHDLEPPADDPKRDCGDGRDAVRWLVSQPHQVPVLIHTTNSRCGSEMETMLKDAGWRVHWTPPFDDLAWVRKAWIRRVGEMLGRLKEP
jgi:hypothetical protein